MRRVRHVVAKPVREVCRVDAGIGPSSYAIGDAKRDVWPLADPADEEGVLAAGGTGALVFAALADWVVGIEGEDVRVGVVASVFCREGCSYAVVYLGA